MQKNDSGDKGSLFSLFGKDAIRNVTVIGLRSARTYSRENQLKWDLGIPELLKEWRALFSPRFLKEDLIAGATVACIAIPLSLAIALASGVEPAAGLITAIVAGIVCALFNGTRLAVSGPAAAMAVIIAANVEEFGLGGLLIIGLITGVLQMLSGILGLGRFARFVPVPVIAGFTAGIGGIILIGQLPRALGLPPPDQAHILDVITHLSELIHTTQPVVVLLTLLTIAINLGLPKVAPKLPSPLISVAFVSGLVALFEMKVPLVGAIPSSLPWPVFPAVPSEGWGSLLASGVIVFLIASLETLLSSSAVDKMSEDQRHDPNQELVGQGLGNIAVALFGGIPVTGVIARSALNVRSGAKTRRSAIFHALIIVASVLFFSRMIALIPIAALAGILLSIAVMMMHPREIKMIWRVSRTEGLVYAVTFFSIIFVDLLAGVRIGIVAALALMVLRLGQMRILIQQPSGKGPARLSLTGAMTFLSSSKVERLKRKFRSIDSNSGLVLDLSRLAAIDTSGAEGLIEFVRELKEKQTRLALLGVPRAVRATLEACDGGGELAGLFALTETDIHARLRGDETDSKDRLIFGVERFRQELRESYEPLMDRLAEGQTPHTLFVTCSDSRINPNLVTSTEPGELFIIRNAGNVIPAFGSDPLPVEGATLEFAIGVLKVRDVVVCGHSSCGAIKACLDPEPYKEFPSMYKLLLHIRNTDLGNVKLTNPDELAKVNIQRQIANLRTYPAVQAALKEGRIRIYGWFFDIAEGEFFEWSEKSGNFIKLGTETLRGAGAR